MIEGGVVKVSAKVQDLHLILKESSFTTFDQLYRFPFQLNIGKTKQGSNYVNIIWDTTCMN